MAPLLNAHCQQPGPSRHHLSLDARHSFLMVPSPELQLSFTKHPWRPSVHNQESFVQLFGYHLPTLCFSLRVPSTTQVQRALPSSHHLSPLLLTEQTSLGYQMSCTALPQNLNTSRSLACVSPKTLLTGSTASQLAVPGNAPLPFRLIAQLPLSFYPNLPWASSAIP